MSLIDLVNESCLIQSDSADGLTESLKRTKSSVFLTNLTVYPRITLNTMPVLIILKNYSVFSDNWEIGTDLWCGFFVVVRDFLESTVFV